MTDKRTTAELQAIAKAVLITPCDAGPGCEVEHGPTQEQRMAFASTFDAPTILQLLDVVDLGLWMKEVKNAPREGVEHERWRAFWMFFGQMETALEPFKRQR